MKKYIYLAFTLLGGLVMMVSSSCNKQSVDASSLNLPVVEAYLSPGQQVTVKLYQQKSLTDTAVYGLPIKSLKVFVSDGSKQVQLTETTPGTYIYTDPAFLTNGKTYSLQFNYLNYTVSATTAMPSKPVNFVSQYSSLTASGAQGPGSANTVLNVFSWSNPDSLNHVLLLKGTNSVIPVNNFGFARPVNSEINTNRASSYNATANTFSYYGDYQVILLRVNQEYINLLKNNTRTSSQDLTQVPTNVVNGFGIFTAMQGDTINFHVY